MRAGEDNEGTHIKKKGEPTSNALYSNLHEQPLKKDTERSLLVKENVDGPVLSVEPALFLVFLSTALTGTVTQRLLLDLVCQRDLNLSKDACLMLNDTTKNIVQPQVTNLLTAKALIENLLPAVMSVFMGAWSDSGGRLPLLKYPALGFTITYTLYGVLSMQSYLEPHYFLFASIPVGLSGGLISVLAGSNSYITDVFPEHKISFRLGIIDACLYLSLLVGNAGLVPLLDALGYVGVYLTAASTCFISFLYVILLVGESIQKKEDKTLNGNGWKSSLPCNNLLRYQMVKDMMVICFQWRPNNERIIIFSLIAAVALNDLSVEGEIIVYYLFTNKTFGWEIQEFSVFASVLIFLRVIAMFVGLHICSKQIAYSDSGVAASCYMTKILGSLIAALAPNVWGLYFGCAVGLFSGVAGPLNRTIIARVVPGKDIGKIYTLTAAAESLTPLLAASLYTQVYNGTIISFPSAFFLLSAAIYTVDSILMGVVTYYQNHPDSDYLPISNLQTEDGT